MFTLKFIKYFPESNQTQTFSVSAEKYEKTEYANKYVFFLVNGVEYRVTSRSAETGDFSSCYVENSAGKTIDRVYVEPLVSVKSEES